MGAAPNREPWQDVAARKQLERESKIPPDWTIPKNLLALNEQIADVSDFVETHGLMTEEELKITNATATEIVAKIASRVWTSEAVAKAVCKRAAFAQQLVNCLTEICFDEAITLARDLDQKQREGETLGPLHGLPISLKDQFNLRGIDSTIGYIAKCGQPATSNSTLVDLLLEAGAVLYCKTNVPATLMMGETVNNVFGRTVNPYNKALSSGGSSGGESALIALKGSPLGVGTDIGGSIRHPCHFTGLFGLRPSHGRVPYQDVTNTFLGQEAVRSCAGPMARSAADLRLFMSSLLTQKPWLRDPQCLPIPWRVEDESLPDQLCFGFGWSDSSVSPTPPLRRAMEITRRKLVAAGHRVIDYTPSEMIEAREIVLKMWSADGGEEFQRDTDASGEPLHPDTEAWLGRSANAPKPTVFETWQNQYRRTQLAQKWSERWEATVNETGTGRPVDGLIMPSLPFPAVPHDSNYPSRYGQLSPLLDLTTGSFPVTKVDQAEDVFDQGMEPASEDEKEVMDFYRHPSKFDNSPVGLSVIARRLEEEKVVAMLQLISNVVGIDY